MKKSIKIQYFSKDWHGYKLSLNPTGTFQWIDGHSLIRISQHHHQAEITNCWCKNQHLYYLRFQEKPTEGSPSLLQHSREQYYVYRGNNTKRTIGPFVLYRIFFHKTSFLRIIFSIRVASKQNTWLHCSEYFFKKGKWFLNEKIFPFPARNEFNDGVFSTGNFNLKIYRL